MIYAVIAAGGIGSRMGAEKPKQYIRIGDKTIIEHTALKFSNNKNLKVSAKIQMI